MEEDIELTFVIPVYNEEAVFASLVQRLQQTMDQVKFQTEVVLVDDGSSDRTPELIADVCRTDPRFRGVCLSRNFGHQRAVSAGLDHARGRCIGILDGDLQDPPEVLLQFHQKLDEGFEVVYGVRQKRKENIFKRLCYWAFYRLLRHSASIDIPLDAGDFCIMRRQVVDAMKAMPERHRFIRGMRSWVGMRQIGVPYDRPARAAGEPKYTFSKLVLLAVDGFLSFTEAPLRVSTWMGAIVAAGSFVWGLYILSWRLFDTPTPELVGWATLGCGMFFLGGVQLLCLGILGEYVARIHNEVKGRPVYVVGRTFGGEHTPDPEGENARGKTEAFAGDADANHRAPAAISSASAS